MSESLYVAAVSPMHKITFLEESKGIENLLPRVFLIGFSVIVTVIAVPSDFFAWTHAFNPLIDCIP